MQCERPGRLIMLTRHGPGAQVPEKADIVTMVLFLKEPAQLQRLPIL